MSNTKEKKRTRKKRNAYFETKRCQTCFAKAARKGDNKMYTFVGMSWFLRGGARQGVLYARQLYLWVNWCVPIPRCRSDRVNSLAFVIELPSGGPINRGSTLTRR